MKLFILCFFAATCAVAIPENFALKSANTLYVVDGDSISMQMRILGIDTPEMRQTCQKIQHKYINCGRLSKKYLQQLLRTLSGAVRIEPVATDFYRRVLVRVYKGDKDIAELMVAAGMAFASGKKYRHVQALAQKSRAGFWGFDVPPIKPSKWRKLHKR